MGCQKSKIKAIHLAPGPEATVTTITKPNGGSDINSQSFRESDDMLPNRLLAAIPVSDLGDSLDSRHLGESLNLSQSLGGHGLPSSSGRGSRIGAPDSADSTDSGYDDYEEEYSHIITENSDPDKVRQVESEFKTVDLPELLVITGRACARILSGYQRNKLEESKILDALREEGLLAQPKGKTAGGVSFEVVDASIVQSDLGGEDVDTFVSAKFIPRKKLERLEERRENIRKPSAKISLEARLAEAEERRKAQEEEKVKLVMERTGLERHGRMRSASALRRENRYSATLAKRQQQLEEMRDKLKEKHKKNDMVRLKQQLLNDSLNLETGYGSETRRNEDQGGFFDD